LGTTIAAGWVQHLREVINTTGYGGPQKEEKGAKVSGFATSAQIRISKGATIQAATHDSAPDPNIPVEGHTLYMHCYHGCVGPDDRRLQVDLLWQYLPTETEQEDGTMLRGTQQVMWFDWDGALGELLWSMKYNDKHKPKIYEYHKNQLNEAIFFTSPKANHIKCDELGLECVSYSAFGKAIKANPEVYAKVVRYLNISEFPSVQDVDIDFEAGDLGKNKRGK
jgi:hypothetical protein